MLVGTAALCGSEFFAGSSNVLFLLSPGMNTVLVFHGLVPEEWVSMFFVQIFSVAF